LRGFFVRCPVESLLSQRGIVQKSHMQPQAAGLLEELCRDDAQEEPKRSAG